MKVWITTYALTKGIYEVEAEIIDDKYAKTPGPWSLFTKDWTKSKEDAVRIADEMRVRKIASLKKSIKKLEALKF